MSIENRAYEALIKELDIKIEELTDEANDRYEELYAKFSFTIKLLEEGGLITQDDFLKELDKENNPLLKDLRRHAEESMFY